MNVHILVAMYVVLFVLSRSNFFVWLTTVILMQLQLKGDVEANVDNILDIGAW